MKILYLSPDVVQREFELIDEVNSCDSLISYFNSFDWEKGNAIIAKRISLDIPYSQQILRFQRSETDFVELSPRGKDDFVVTCVNRTLVFEDYVSGNINTQEFSIEEFLEDFWGENLIDKYSFEEINDSEEKDLHSSSHFGIKMLWPLLFLLLTPILMLIDAKKGKESDIILLAGMSAIILVFMSPYFIRLFQYFKFNGNSSINVNRKKKTITFTKAGQSQIFFFQDITRSRIMVNAKQEMFSAWAYLLLEAGPKDRMVITKFLYDDLTGLAQLLNTTPGIEPSFFPFIQLKIKTDDQLKDEKHDYDLKVQEFTDKWSGKSKEELMKIKQDVTGYAPYAIEAANKLLKKRNN